jgi:hypothetical protein
VLRAVAAGDVDVDHARDALAGPGTGA